MSNIEILDNVVHRGILLKKGMIVATATQELDKVAQNLIDRNLAKSTESAVTHTAAIVNGTQEAMPVSSTAGGQKPAVVEDDARKAAAKAAQTPADPSQAQAVQDKAASESQPRVVDPLAGRSNGPSAADVEGV